MRVSSCGRRATVFSVLLGIVIGFSLAYCFIIVNYCVVIWKGNILHKVIPPKKVVLGPRTSNEHLSVTDNSINLPKTNIPCDDKPSHRAFKQRADFWVLYNYVVAEAQFGCGESITYTTQGDYTFLDNLPVLVERWQGPISVALYAPGYDFNATLDSIAYLRNCETNLIRTFVSFHLFFGYKDIPDVGETPLQNFYTDTYNCTNPPPYLNISKKRTYKEKKGLTYPINVARNIARETARTYFILASDIELYPTRYLIPKFFDMISRYTIDVMKHSVFVLPLFEIKADQKIPETKTKLQNMLASKTAFIFHEKVCLICHNIPESAKWKRQAETEGLDVFSSTKRTGKFRFWEPFYIGTNENPLFDERLTWEGQSNKMTQAYSMCLLNYTYLVLDNAFLIHKPGIKKQKVQLQRHPNLVRNTNKLIRNVIKGELDTIYGTNDECYL